MLICKICNPNMEGNGYCGEHSTGGTAYGDKILSREMKECPRHKGIMVNYSEECNCIEPIKKEGFTDDNLRVDREPPKKSWEDEFDKLRIWKKLDRIIESDIGIGFEDRISLYAGSDNNIKSFITELLLEEKKQSFDEGRGSLIMDSNGFITKTILPKEMLSYGDFSNKDAVHFRNGWNACREDIRQLIDCEIDCIKSGNGVTPSEQNIAVKTAKNIEIRINGL